jgi:hypothetical protein
LHLVPLNPGVISVPSAIRSHPNAVGKLRNLTTFEDLVDYLRDDLDWPIEAEDARDITFTYTPEELGIAPQHAAKIKSIKQVRPLTPDQSWGIFYVAFESKRLPIVVLRRILRALVPQRRKRSADQPVWNLSDCGVGDQPPVSQVVRQAGTPTGSRGSRAHGTSPARDNVAKDIAW